MTARIEYLVTSGTFSLDGQTFEVDNNVWLLGDDEVLVVDAPHDADVIAAAVGGRTVVAIACTHAHDDHCSTPPSWRSGSARTCCCTPTTGCCGTSSTRSTSRTASLWTGCGCRSPALTSTCFRPLVTPPAPCASPSRTSGSSSPATLCSPAVPVRRAARTARTILDSFRTRLFALPPETRVLTGHGDETTVGVEAPSYDEWVRRGV